MKAATGIRRNFVLLTDELQSRVGSLTVNDALAYLAAVEKHEAAVF